MKEGTALPPPCFAPWGDKGAYSGDPPSPKAAAWQADRKTTAPSDLSDLSDRSDKAWLEPAH